MGIIDDEAQPHTRDDHLRVFREQGQANHAHDDSGQCAQKNHNSIGQMVTAGSKGSYINISRMSGCVGGSTPYVIIILSSDTAKLYEEQLQPRNKSCIGSLLPFRLMLLSCIFHAVSRQESLQNFFVLWTFTFTPHFSTCQHFLNSITY